jgi:hypothetical protein
MRNQLAASSALPLLQSLARVNIRRRLACVETAIAVVLKDGEVLLRQHTCAKGDSGERR